MLLGLTVASRAGSRILVMATEYISEKSVDFNYVTLPSA
jgi:hypothetical protein